MYIVDVNKPAGGMDTPPPPPPPGAPKPKQPSRHAVFYQDMLPGMLSVGLLGSAIYLVRARTPLTLSARPYAL